MADDRGMIFDFHARSRWPSGMRNTLIPLDMLFVTGEARILNIARMANPHDETPIPSAGPIRAVIEINGGLAGKLGIAPRRPGDRRHHLPSRLGGRLRICVAGRGRASAKTRLALVSFGVWRSLVAHLLWGAEGPRVRDPAALTKTGRKRSDPR